MATVYMTTEGGGLGGGDVTFSLECREGMLQALVPFGASAPRVPNPDKKILGGKGMGLQEMSSIDGIRVPPGFTLTTTLCAVYDKHGDFPEEIWSQVANHIARIEKDMGRKFGDATNPLLFSCRSGAAISMPGMMDTVLNVGLNDETVEGLAAISGNRRFAFDSYRRLLDMFGDVVLGMEHEAFEAKLVALKQQVGVQNDVDFSAEHLQQLCRDYYQVYADHQKEFPTCPMEQLKACIKAVFGSWNAERAIKYREINKITNLLGTACNIQTMVFGNLGETSGTGVAFSRDPGTGEAKLKGEYLINAQGEDVVAGIRTPEDICKMKEKLPEAYEQFMTNVGKLERHFRDMQDVEFTVENGQLWMLQCRSGKRTGQAAFQIACDLVDEGICSIEHALLLIEPNHVKQLLHPTFSSSTLASPLYKENIVAVGLPGGPGGAVGRIIFNTKKAEQQAGDGTAEGGIILVREVTSPEDVGGMWASKGILTSRGGVTSHAAVVARGWGKPCVVGCDELVISEGSGTMTVKSTGQVFKEGDVISINGSTGEVISVPIETTTPILGGNFARVLGWADAIPDSLKVLTNADSKADSAKALELGAQGIGLCRTEHMFFTPQERLPVVRRWILRGEGLEKVKEFQRADFKEIFKIMEGKPVTVRLLDPPLHEFLPRQSEVNARFAYSLGYEDSQALLTDIDAMHEENPMLGLRGCRLGIVHSELTVMQVEAIMNACADLIEEDPNTNAKNHPFPRIMVPLVGNVKEFAQQALLIKKTAERVKQERQSSIRYEIGTMIEVPRAALVSDQIAACVDPQDGKPLCDFFSYGTNDLTQMTLGISRDDAAAFVPKYREMGIFEHDPFKTIDRDGVGWLLRLSAAKGREARATLSLSICGEHGGDAKSIEFFDSVGLDYVSCSPFRVPVARLCAGQAAIRREKGTDGIHFLHKADRVINLAPQHSFHAK